MMLLPPDHQLLQIISLFFIAACVGSFLNVVIHRLPLMMEAEWQSQCAELSGGATPNLAIPKFNLAVPKSHCPKCNYQLRAIDNIPIVSFLFLKGKCRNCHAPISLRYPLIELVTGLGSASLILFFGPNFLGYSSLFLFWSLLCLTLIDLDTQLLPDSITLPLVWMGLLVNLDQGFTDIHSSVIGAAAGYLSLWSIYWLFKLITGKEGMGYGDFKLLAALGAWLGWQLLPVIILLSSVVGAITGIALIIFAKHGRQQPIPFGPYLAGAGCIALLFGKDISTHYLGLLL